MKRNIFAAALAALIIFNNLNCSETQLEKAYKLNFEARELATFAFYTGSNEKKIEFLSTASEKARISSSIYSDHDRPILAAYSSGLKERCDKELSLLYVDKKITPLLINLRARL